MAGDVAEDFLIGLGIGDDAGDIAELGEEKCRFLPELGVVAEKYDILRAGDNAFLKYGLAIVCFGNAACEVQAAARKKHAVNVEAAKRLLGDQADVGTRPRIVETAGADEVEIASSFQCCENIQGIGQNCERVVGQKLGESQCGGGSIEENRFVRLNAFGCLSRDGGLLIAIGQLALGERNFLANFQRTCGTAVNPNQIAAFFEGLKVLAYSFVGDVEQGGDLHGAEVAGLVQLRENFLLSFQR